MQSMLDATTPVSNSVCVVHPGECGARFLHCPFVLRSRSVCVLHPLCTPPTRGCTVLPAGGSNVAVLRAARARHDVVRRHQR